MNEYDHYLISKQRIINMLKTLHDFNKLTDQVLKLMSTELEIDLMTLCKENGIIWNITCDDGYIIKPNIPIQLLCPKCQSSLVLHYPGSYKCQSCGHIWMKE